MKLRYIETIKIVDGVLQNIEAHLRRMERTIARRHLLELNNEQSGTVKCRVVYDENGIIEITYNSYVLPSIRTLKIVECPTIEYGKKSEDRTAIAELYSQRDSEDDILITQNGAVTDTSFCNVVFENSDGLFTPDTCLLAGTKRQLLIDSGIVSECRITTHDIPKYDKIHLINAMLELGEVTISAALMRYKE